MNIMKKISVISSIIIIFSTFLFSQRLDIGRDKLVKVNNVIITLKELENRYNELAKLLPEGQRPTKKVILTQMINEELILAEVRNDKSLVLNEEQFNQLKEQQKYIYIQGRRQKDPNYQYSEEEFRNYLEKEIKITYEKYEEKLKEQVLTQQYIGKKAEPKVQGLREKNYISKSDFPVEIIDERGNVQKFYSLKDFYDKNPDQFLLPKYTELKHIVVYTKAPGDNNTIIDLPKEEKERKKKLMNDIYKRLKNGENFGELCEMFSEDIPTRDHKDQKTGKYNRGYIGRIPIAGVAADFFKRQFGENLFNELFNLPKGRFSPVMEGTIGYHIFFVVDKKEEGGLYSFEEVKDQIVNYFRAAEYNKIVSDELEATIKDLKRKASIVYYNDEYKE